MNRPLLLLSCLALGVALSGCDPWLRSRIVTTVFDGVPALPNPTEYCQAYHEHATAKEKAQAEAAKQKDSPDKMGSEHPPYEERRCNDCHDQSKGDAGGLKLPRNELCESCHTGFVQGTFVHGPVAVRDCLSCHEPHTSAYSSLLKMDRKVICIVCHHEERQTAAMHKRFVEQSINCVDCHNPHASNIRFFLF